MKRIKSNTRWMLVVALLSIAGLVAVLLQSWDPAPTAEDGLVRLEQDSLEFAGGESDGGQIQAGLSGRTNDKRTSQVAEVSVRIRVLARNRQPILTARLTIEGPTPRRELQMGEDGSTASVLLAQGHYVLHAEADGFVSRAISVALEGTRPEPLDILLDTHGAIQGWIVLPDIVPLKLELLYGQLRLVQQGSRLGGQYLELKDTAFYVPNVYAGEYEVSAEARINGTRWSATTTTRPGVRDVMLVLERAAPLSKGATTGVVADKSGKATPFATVAWRQVGRSEVSTLNCDAHGRFELPGLVVPGAHDFVAFAQHVFLPTEWETALRQRTTVPVTGMRLALTELPGFQITSETAATEDNPVAVQMLLLGDRHPRKLSFVAFSGSKWSVAGVAPKTWYSVLARRANGIMASHGGLTKEGAATIQLIWRRGDRIEGYVPASGRSGLTDPVVHAHGFNGLAFEAECAIAANGRFVLDGLAPGRWWLQVLDKGGHARPPEEATAVKTGSRGVRLER